MMMIFSLDQTKKALGDAEPLCLGQDESSDLENAGACEYIEYMDEDSVQRFFELLTTSLSQQVRLLNRNFSSGPEETYVQEDIPESAYARNGAGSA